MPKKQVTVEGKYLSPAEAKKQRLKRQIKAMSTEERGALVEGSEEWTILCEVQAEELQAELKKPFSAYSMMTNALKAGKVYTKSLAQAAELMSSPEPHHHYHQSLAAPQPTNQEVELRYGPYRVTVGTAKKISQRVKYEDTAMGSGASFYDDHPFYHNVVLEIDLATVHKANVYRMLGLHNLCGEVDCTDPQHWSAPQTTKKFF